MKFGGNLAKLRLTLLVKPLGGFAVEGCQVSIEHHTLAADQVNALGDVTDGQRRGCWGSRHGRHAKATCLRAAPPARTSSLIRHQVQKMPLWLSVATK